MESFYLKLADIMEVDEVRADSILTDFPEWDSLTVLSVIAMVHERYGLSLTARDLKGVETARELHTLVAAKRGN